LGLKQVSQVKGLGQNCVRYLQELGGGLSFSWKIVTTEVKGWITKNSVPKGGNSHENTCIIHHLHQIALWV
jgi:hypothetical protein